MKPESLHALLIDRDLGELSADTVELLDAWLAEHPESAGIVPSLRRTLETAGAAVRRFPELARPEPPQPKRKIFVFPVFRLMPLAWAAAVLILLAGSGWLGFRAGQQSAQHAQAAKPRALTPTAAVNTVKREGPWARYALATAPRGGLTVVRYDSNP
jgi:hypothetical protein